MVRVRLIEFVGIAWRTHGLPRPLSLSLSLLFLSMYSCCRRASINKHSFCLKIESLPQFSTNQLILLKSSRFEFEFVRKRAVQLERSSAIWKLVGNNPISPELPEIFFSHVTCICYYMCSQNGFHAETPIFVSQIKGIEFVCRRGTKAVCPTIFLEKC